MGQSASVHIGGGSPELDPSVPSVPDGSVVVVSPAVVVPSVSTGSVVVPSGDPVVIEVVDGSLGLLVFVPESLPCDVPPVVVGVSMPVVGWPVVVIELVSIPVGLVGAVGIVVAVGSVLVPLSPHASSNGETSAATLPTLRYRIHPS